MCVFKLVLHLLIVSVASEHLFWQQAPLRVLNTLLSFWIVLPSVFSQPSIRESLGLLTVCGSCRTLASRRPMSVAFL